MLMMGMHLMMVMTDFFDRVMSIVLLHHVFILIV